MTVFSASCSTGVGGSTTCATTSAAPPSRSRTDACRSPRSQAPTPTTSIRTHSQLQQVRAIRIYCTALPPSDRCPRVRVPDDPLLLLEVTSLASRGAMVCCSEQPVKVLASKCMSNNIYGVAFFAISVISRAVYIVVYTLGR